MSRKQNATNNGTVEDKLFRKMQELNYGSYMIDVAKKRIKELQENGVPTDKFVQKLLDRVSEKEAYLDIMIEGRFAVILARNGFSRIQIEHNRKGPDIKAQYNRSTVFFEVKRYRATKQDEEVQKKAAFVAEKKCGNVILNINDKLSQLQIGALNIIVLWSDTVGCSVHVVRQAGGYLQKQPDYHKKYRDLSGILFTNGGVNMSTLRQCYLVFRNPLASKAIKPRLSTKLESLRERGINELQREYHQLVASMERVRQNLVASEDSKRSSGTN